LIVDNSNDLVARGRVAVDIGGSPRDGVGTNGEVSKKRGCDGVCTAVVSVRRRNRRSSALSGSGDKVGGAAVNDRGLIVSDNNRKVALVGVSSGICDVDTGVGCSNRECSSRGDRVVVVDGETAVVCKVGEGKVDDGIAETGGSKGGDGCSGTRNGSSDRSIVINDGKGCGAGISVSRSICNDSVGSVRSNSKESIGKVRKDGALNATVV